MTTIDCVAAENAEIRAMHRILNGRGGRLYAADGRFIRNATDRETFECLAENAGSGWVVGCELSEDVWDSTRFLTWCEIVPCFDVFGVLPDGREEWMCNTRQKNVADAVACGWQVSESMWGGKMVAISAQVVGDEFDASAPGVWFE